MSTTFELGVSTTIRCRSCRRETDARGPSGLGGPSGWQVDRAAFYTPSGHHYCPQHVVQSWVAWCADPKMSEGYGDDLNVHAPHGLTEFDVIARLEGRTCPDGHEYVGAVLDATFYPHADVEL